jgi:hypothetical protein
MIVIFPENILSHFFRLLQSLQQLWMTLRRSLMNHGVTSDVLVHLMLKNWNALLHA